MSDDGNFDADADAAMREAMGFSSFAIRRPKDDSRKSIEYMLQPTSYKIYATVQMLLHPNPLPVDCLCIGCGHTFEGGTCFLFSP
jgi:hypothetical protein